MAKRKRTNDDAEHLSKKKPDKDSALKVQKKGSSKDHIDEVWSKSKKKRMRRLLAKLAREEREQDGANSKGNNKRNDKRNSNTNSNTNSKEETGRSTKKVKKGGEKKGESKESQNHKQQMKDGGNETQAEKDQKQGIPTDVPVVDSHPKVAGGKKRQKSALQESFLARLSGARFRELNEQLYTTTSESAFEAFSSAPELYDQYHEGFRHQVEGWPVNPVNVIVRSLVSQYGGKGKSKNKFKNNAKDTALGTNSASCTVADFGCGDAELAKKLLAIKRKGSGKAEASCPFVVHSFDLVASCPLVTACDMARVPLPDKSVDVAVFCLSLMGTNLADFVREAYRVLKPNGTVKIAEVRSRFESTDPKKDELKDFIGVLEKLGFDCTKKDRSNKMFVVLDLQKSLAREPDTKLEFSAKPCIYKRR